METVDSREKVLSVIEILNLVSKQIHTSGVPRILAIWIVLGEMQRKDTVQFGNTVFLSEIFPQPDGSNKMIGRAFNVDKARNFIQNGLKYHEYMKSKNISEYITEFEGKILIPAMRIFKKLTDTSSTEVFLNKFSENSHSVLVKVGKD